MSGNKAKGAARSGPATITNRRAGFDYHFEDEIEAGIVLVGSEVKSLYLGRANLTDSFCKIIDGEAWLMNMDVEPYAQASHFGHERRRDRKLLLHRRELDTLKRKTLEKGLALIPTKVYFVKGKVKVRVCLARGKQSHDKRESIKEKDMDKQMRRGEY
ncbi:MAG: SsrA-binding protein SmpB [Armatimonadota bacterium]